MIKHLIFFDGNCPLCHRAVRFVLHEDKNKIFGFAPLQGKTALRELTPELRKGNGDTMVLLQNYGADIETTLIRGKAAFRILWLLGGGWALLGSLSFLPSFLFDLVYRLIAKYRYKIFSPKPLLTDDLGDRLLD